MNNKKQTKKRKNYRDTLAEERTILAKQRTRQSYIRTGAALIGMGIVVLKIFEQIFWPLFLGVLLIAIGIFLILHHSWWNREYSKRHKYVENNLRNKVQNEHVSDRHCKQLRDKIKEYI